MNKQRWRILITLAFAVIGVVASWDTIRLWSMSEEESQALMESDPDAYKDLMDGAMRLGLDLQGGIHTVVRVKLEDISEESRTDAVERVREIIRNRVDPEGVFEPIIQTQGDDRIIVDLPGWKDEKRAEQLIGQTARLEFKMLETMQTVQPIIEKIDSVVALANKTGDTMSTAADDDASESPADTSSTELADNTADTTDTTGASDDDLLSEILGDADTTGDDTSGLAEATDEDAPFSSLITYSQFNNRTGTSWPAFTIPAEFRRTVEKYLAMPEVKRVIPKGIQVAYSTRNTVETNVEVFKLYFLEDEVRFLGENLENIRLGNDQLGAPTVDFSLSGQAAKQFAALTGNNIDKPFAIVLDDRVESAPFINGRISTNGMITMGGGGPDSDVSEEARILATVLKAGALPAPVEIIEKNVVGPTLGSDSIEKGLRSSLVGLALVVLFIAVYYRISGIVADIALLFNLFFLLALMAGLGATLTMPGIAGIILTIGIAVDANILIFERIREELEVGKHVRSAIDAGYDRAWVAILDSHVTTMITAAALYLFGSGPIRGFAVTLFWGVTLSLFTAFFITRMVFDIRKQYKSISI